jgi:hypothetical protein
VAQFTKASARVAGAGAGPNGRDVLRRLYAAAETAVTSFCEARFTDFEGLRVEEDTLGRDLELFTQRLEKWDNVANVTEDTARSRASGHAGLRAGWVGLGWVFFFFFFFLFFL